MNNSGFGTKETILMFCIIIFCMLMVGFCYEIFKGSIDDGEPQVTTKVSGVKKEKQQNVDKDYYIKYEEKLEKASLKYVDFYDYNLTNDNIRVDLQTLIKFGFMEKVVDSKDKTECSGYALVNKNRTPVGYIKCSSYETGK